MEIIISGLGGDGDMHPPLMRVEAIAACRFRVYGRRLTALFQRRGLSCTPAGDLPLSRRDATLLAGVGPPGHGNPYDRGRDWGEPGEAAASRRHGRFRMRQNASITVWMMGRRSSRRRATCICMGRAPISFTDRRCGPSSARRSPR